MPFRALLAFLAIVSLASPGAAQQRDSAPAPVAAGQPIDRSGGLLLPEQAAYDVTFYDLALSVNPADSTIAGTLAVHARVVLPLSRLVLDLDTTMTVTAVTIPGDMDSPAFERIGGRLWVVLPRTLQPGEQVAARVTYHGRPRVGSFGGFSWARTPSGAPWVATSVETPGADVWWPVKDHPSDEPDSMALHYTVPMPLVAVGNGRARGVRDNGDGTRTFDWFVSTPINNYGVTMNVAPYVEVTAPYLSTAGDSMNVTFWALPEDSASARGRMPEFLDHMRFLEEIGGPYPFRRDKYGIVQTPFLGMEHQTLIAYGAGFRNDAMARYDWGFDALHQHELAHEWWGNQITPPDWNDLWLHEAFAQYMQPLYAERRISAAKARDIMTMARSRVRATPLLAVAPRETQNSGQAYARDIYWRGSWVLHSLRYVMGDDHFLTLLRQWNDPMPPVPTLNPACRCRFATTDDLLRLASRVAGRDLTWFFEVYLRQAELPRLAVQREGKTVSLRWEAPAGLPFPMPVPVRVNGRNQVVEMVDGRGTFKAPATATLDVDPDGWILRGDQ